MIGMRRRGARRSAKHRKQNHMVGETGIVREFWVKWAQGGEGDGGKGSESGRGKGAEDHLVEIYSV